MKEYRYTNFLTTAYPKESTELESHYKEALDWIQSLGIPIKNTRLEIYNSSLKGLPKTIEELLKEENEERGLTKFLELQKTLGEISEIIRIHTSFKKIDAELFTSKLKKISSGKPFTASSANDPSRDFAFELSIAGRFIRAGFEVDLNQLADLIAIIDNKIIFIECKRIKSEKQIEKRLKEARDQISRRNRSTISKKNFGFIAANITPILIPNDQLLTAKDVHIAKTIHESHLHSFARKIDEKKIRFPTETSGIFYESSNQILITEPPHPHALIRGATFLRMTKKHEHIETINKFIPLISNQNLT